jgi:hypothetical protein
MLLAWLVLVGWTLGTVDGRRALGRAGRDMAAVFRSPPQLSRQDARIAAYEQEYVNGTLDLEGLERAVAGALGMRPVAPPPKPDDAARAARSSTPVLLDAPEPVVGFTHSAPATAIGHAYRSETMAWSAYPPGTMLAADDPREMHELVDATGRIIARYPKYLDERLPTEPDPRLRDVQER